MKNVILVIHEFQQFRRSGSAEVVRGAFNTVNSFPFVILLDPNDVVRVPLHDAAGILEINRAADVRFHFGVGNVEKSAFGFRDGIELGISFDVHNGHLLCD